MAGVACHKNVCFGYSMYLPLKQHNSTFNSYNLFLDVILIQNIVNVFLIAQILRLTPSMICVQENVSEV